MVLKKSTLQNFLVITLLCNGVTHTVTARHWADQVTGGRKAYLSQQNTSSSLGARTATPSPAVPLSSTAVRTPSVTPATSSLANTVDSSTDTGTLQSTLPTPTTFTAGLSTACTTTLSSLTSALTGNKTPTPSDIANVTAMLAATASAKNVPVYTIPQGLQVINLFSAAISNANFIQGALKQLVVLLRSRHDIVGDAFKRVRSTYSPGNDRFANENMKVPAIGLAQSIYTNTKQFASNPAQAGYSSVTDFYKDAFDAVRILAYRTAKSYGKSNSVQPWYDELKKLAGV